MTTTLIETPAPDPIADAIAGPLPHDEDAITAPEPEAPAVAAPAAWSPRR